MSSRPAECHPDRPLYARGMCQQCYGKDNLARKRAQKVARALGDEGETEADGMASAAALLGSPTTTEVEKASPRALCHPRRPNFADGKCKACFARDVVMVNGGLGGLASGDQEYVNRGRLVEFHSAVDRIQTLVAEAQAILRERLPKYADLHWKAAQVAAVNGDTRPIEWFLQNLKLPPGLKLTEAQKGAPGNEGGGDKGVKVVVGIHMGALPADVMRADVVTIDTKALPPTDPPEPE